MIELALDLLASWGGLAVRWVWQAALFSALALLLNRLLGARAPRLRFILLSMALLRFAVPPLAGVVPELPMSLTGPSENGIEVMVADADGTRALAWPGWSLAIAVFGSLMSLLLLVRQSMGLGRLVGESEVAAPNIVLTARALSRQLGVKTPPSVVVSERAVSPFVTGWMRPVIVLPRQLVEGLPARDLRQILAHEVVHLANRDIHINYLTAVLGVLWWFHPLFRMVAAAHAEIREERCDHRVLQTLRTTRVSYARALIGAAAVCRPALSWAAAAALLSHRSHPLEKRLARLGHSGGQGRRRTTTVLSFAVLALAVVVFSSSAGSTPSEDARQIVFVHAGAHQAGFSGSPAAGSPDSVADPEARHDPASPAAHEHNH